MTEKRSLYLYDMSWRDVKEALPDIRVAIIPTGSSEQHGPNGTFEVDTGRAREFSKRLGERLYPHALVAPCINIGISPHHMHFPGTISLRAETFTQVLMDVVESLHHHGIRRFLFVNGHGGNRPALSIVVNRIRHEMGARAAWVSPTSVADDVVKANQKSAWTGHACESEMSQCMYLCPETVKWGKLEKGQIVPEALEAKAGIPVEEGKFWEENTVNGALGDATQASAELGKQIIETALDRVTEWLKGFMEKPV